MRDVFKKGRLPGFYPGALKSSIFILLLGLAIGFWLYTQMIFERVKEYQQQAIRTQIEVYVSLIDPRYYNDSGMDSKLIDNLVQKFVFDSPYKVIFSDEYLNPVEGWWRNVEIDPADKTTEARQTLIEIMKRMDRENKPEPFLIPQLGGYRTDTLRVYELPPSRFFPIVVTDAEGEALYSRNLPSSNNSPSGVEENIGIIDAVSTPVRFSKENAPQLVFHGANYMGRWPIVVVNERTGEPVYWKGVGETAGFDSTGVVLEKITAAVERIKEEGVSYRLKTTYPVTVYRKGLLHYGDLEFLFLIKWLPFIQFAVIIILLTVGFIGLKSITNAEQRSIWVGMAKETAHQLGTPISSIGGWLELLKTDQDPALLDQAIGEMEYDVLRLTRVAARFSSIGSRPELQLMRVSDVIDEVLDYWRARVPHMGRSVTLESQYSGPMKVMGNHELLNWAFENLVKNSLAALDNRQGIISVTGTMSKDFHHIILDFKDNGKGIPYQDQNKVMRPGFTTKKRGWGLGLSLGKRIIEEYHGGRFLLHESKPGAGTIFRVVLPAANGGDIPESSGERIAQTRRSPDLSIT
ncbi:MAG: sensor histidine kinase [Candidatus Latescibacterota bacterium]